MQPKTVEHLHICFVAPFAYSILSGKNFRNCGGAEVQQVLIAESIKDKVGKISFIVDDRDLQVQEIINGKNIIPCPFRYFGGSKWHYLKDTIKLFLVLRSISPDLILLKTPRSLLLALRIYRSFSNLKIIKLTAHDSDFHIIGNWYQKLIYKAGMSGVDHYVYQSDYQKSIGDKQKLSGTIIKNIIHSPRGNKKDDKFNTDVLWVGKNIRRKNPELFIKIAEYMPEFQFAMISAEGNDVDYNNQIKNSASLVSNLTYLGQVEYDKTWRYFNDTKLLLHTSYSEGFPNVFLQAWQCEVPVITYNIDLDQIIQKNNIGIVTHSFNEIIKETKGMLKNNERRKEYGREGKQYVEHAHNYEFISSNYLRLFRQFTC